MFYYRSQDDSRPRHELPRFSSLEELGMFQQDEAEMLAELAAEAAMERFFEEGTEAQRMQYQWEVEQDEARAMGMRF